MECVYVAQGKAGLLKVGKTTNITRRLTSLRAEFRRRGDELRRHEALPEIICAHGAEWRVIHALQALQKPISGREWFQDVDYDAALPEALMLDDSPVMQGLGVLAKEFSDVVQEICASSADDDISDNELARAEKEWGQVVAAGQRVLGAMRAKNQTGKLRRVA